jgi:poly-gamma-glutamate synthesis protein (capsule biosynthesis protein)
LTRRGFLSRAALPLLGAVPVQWRIAGAPAEPARTRLVLGGDVMLSRHVGRLARLHGDPAWPLRGIAAVFRQADIAFVNLESPFLDRGPLVESGMRFKAEPEMIAGLRLAGVDVVSTANNHARDMGSAGLEFTLEWLSRNGVAAAGTGRTPQEAHAGAILERHGLRFGFLAYTYDQSNGNHSGADPRVAVMEIAEMRRDVELLSQRADVIVVSMHAGVEYSAVPNAQQKEFARTAIDAGARLVAGHHPHVVQGWERYRNGVIFYSLGNLVFDQYHRPDTQRGVVGEVVFEGPVLAGANVRVVEIVRSVPRLADSSEPPMNPVSTGEAGVG